jgi:F-type H+-transporting ATPase subunit delta
VNPTLEGYAAAIFEDARQADAAGPLAADLVALHNTVANNGPLHALLTDTAISGPDRRAVVEDLLADRVSPAARRLAAYAAARVSGPEVPTAIDWLALRAAEVVNGQPVVERPLGHAAARRRVGGYAAAIFEELPTDRLEEIEDELFRFARTVESTPALRSALTDAELAVDARTGIVDDLIGSKVQPGTQRLVDFAIGGGRPRDLVGTLDWLVEQTAAARGWRVARVRAAAPVADDQAAQLGDSLAHLTGSPVELQVTVEPSLLGGVVVEIGDLLVDASARGRLDRLREHLLPGGWENRGFGRSPNGSSSEGAQ